MNLRKNIIISFSLLLTFLLLLSCSQTKKLKVATDPNWPPMEMLDEKNQLIGYDIDLMNEIAKRGNFKVEFVIVNWDKLFQGLDEGLYDAVIADVGITEERKKKYDFSFPYINAGQVLVVRKEMSNYTNLSQMIDRKVGAQDNTIGSEEVKKVKGVIFMPYKSISTAFEELYKGKIDGVVCGFSTAAHHIKKNTNYNEKMIISSKPFTMEPSGIVIKKGNISVKNLINKGLKIVLQEKIDEKLENKWLR